MPGFQIPYSSQYTLTVVVSIIPVTFPLSFSEINLTISPILMSIALGLKMVKVFDPQVWTAGYSRIGAADFQSLADLVQR